MELTLVDQNRRPVSDPYLVRMPGWTLERYLEEAPDHRIWEFVRGEVIMHSPVAVEHQRLVKLLLRLLDVFCEVRKWGEVLTGPAALRVLPDVVREPDLFVLPPGEVPKAKGVALDLRPVLVIEVISPSTRAIDLEQKPDEYARAGIPEYWAVDSEREKLIVHRLGEGRTAYHVEAVGRGWLESGSVPGFRLKAEWLFQDPLPPATACLKEILQGP